MKIRVLTAAMVAGLVAVLFFARGASSINLEKNGATVLLAQAQSAPATGDECAVKRSRKPGATTDFTKARLKGADTKISSEDARELSRKPPGGLCNKACRLCPNPQTGRIWCDICEACYYNVE
jgi:hypothetical protein